MYIFKKRIFMFYFFKILLLLILILDELTFINEERIIYGVD